MYSPLASGSSRLKKPAPALVGSGVEEARARLGRVGVGLDREAPLAPGHEFVALVQLAQDVRLGAEGLDLLRRVDVRLTSLPDAAHPVPRVVEAERALGSLGGCAEELHLPVERERLVAQVVEHHAHAGVLDLLGLRLAEPPDPVRAQDRPVLAHEHEPGRHR